jgi:hypothetical protein
MTNISRTLVLNTLIKHETLTITDLAKKENLGMVANKFLLNFLLDDLVKSGEVQTLNGVIPVTYTITDAGIKEGERLNETIVS